MHPNTNSNHFGEQGEERKVTQEVNLRISPPNISVKESGEWGGGGSKLERQHR